MLQFKLYTLVLVTKYLDNWSFH